LNFGTVPTLWYFLIFILAYMEDVECYLLFPYIFYTSKKSKDIFFVDCYMIVLCIVMYF